VLVVEMNLEVDGMTNVIPAHTLNPRKEGPVNPPITASRQHGPQPAPASRLHGEPVAVICVDYGSTISLDKIDHQLGEKPVDPVAATALRTLHEYGITLLIANNTMPCEKRWPALQQAGIDHLFGSHCSHILWE
jgi:hypothetical protein